MFGCVCYGYVPDTLSGDGEAVLSWLSLADFAESGAVKADAEPMIDLLRSLRGVRVACMLREQEGEVRDYYRRKFRYVLIDEYQDTNRLRT